MPMFIFLQDLLFFISITKFNRPWKKFRFSKFKSFYSIILPAARPAIVAGLSLVAMETLAEFGAVVDFFSVNTLTTGIYNAWITFDDLAFANRISFFSFVIYIYSFSD